MNAKLDFADVWARFNEQLIRLVDYIPDDKINWSPKPELGNFRGILLHIAATRDSWLDDGVHDGIGAPNVWQTVRSKEEIKAAYARTWERLATFLSTQAQLDREYEVQDPGKPVEMASAPLDRLPPARARHPPSRRHLPLPGAARHRDAGRRHAAVIPARPRSRARPQAVAAPTPRDSPQARQPASVRRATRSPLP